MKSRKLMLILVSLFVLLAMLFSACTPASTPTTQPDEAEVEETQPVEEPQATEEVVVEEPAEPVTVTYWHTMSQPEADQLDVVIDAFEAANPGITIEPTRYAWADFKQALLTAIAGGEVPDVVRMDIIWVPEFADQGVLMQFDGNLPEFEAIAEQVFPGPLSTNFFNGHYYGLPQNTNTQVLLWNKAMFEAAGLTEAPKTIEEFADYACQLSDASAEKYGYGMGGTYFWAPAPIFYAMGGKVADEGITTADGYINGPESVAAFSMLTDLYNDGCLSPNLLGGGIGTEAGIATDLYAMIVDGPWMVSMFEADYPGFTAQYDLIPAGPTGTSSVVGGEDVVIFEDSANKEAAMAWVTYLMSEEAQKGMAQVGMMPTLASLTGDPSMPEYFGVFMEQLETAQARLPHPKWSAIDDAINNAFQRMLKAEQTPQEALDQAAQEINALIQ